MVFVSMTLSYYTPTDTVMFHMLLCECYLRGWGGEDDEMYKRIVKVKYLYHTDSIQLKS